MILSWLVCSKTSRVLHQYWRGQGFKSHTSLIFFRLSFPNCKSCVKNYNLVHFKIVLDLLLPIMLQFFTIPPELHSKQNSVVQSIICAGEMLSVNGSSFLLPLFSSFLGAYFSQQPQIFFYTPIKSPLRILIFTDIFLKYL